LIFTNNIVVAKAREIQNRWFSNDLLFFIQKWHQFVICQISTTIRIVFTMIFAEAFSSLINLHFSL